MICSKLRVHQTRNNLFQGDQFSCDSLANALRLANRRSLFKLKLRNISGNTFQKRLNHWPFNNFLKIRWQWNCERGPIMDRLKRKFSAKSFQPFKSAGTHARRWIPYVKTFICTRIYVIEQDSHLRIIEGYLLEYFGGCPISRCNIPCTRSPARYLQ